ncbi:MAG: GFA family protein [Candidatus Moraniibacteriota bacterium]|nr:MAG: GFA family protein [Candidatus Moranbacteria bacterium]
MANQYQGKCHCGKVAFEVETDLASVLECNCSHCSMKGMLLAFVPGAQFRLLSGVDDLVEYRFNKKTLQHLFCRFCGVQPIAKGKDPTTGAETVAINVRTLTDVDIAKLTLTPFDGKSW